MSSNKTQKWSSSASLTKFFSRLTRTLSFSSKKNKNTSQSVPKNTLCAPKSVPVIRRHPAQPVSKILYSDNIIPVNMYDNSDEDSSRYSLRPDLSLFNISMHNLHHQQNNWIDDVLHSTKIEHY